MAINIDIAIFIRFLTLNLIIVFYTVGKKDYALGGRNFSTAASTTVATFVTGSGFFISLSKTYSNVLPFAIASLSSCLQFVITGFFLIPRISEFMGALSIAEVMGNFIW